MSNVTVPERHARLLRPSRLAPAIGTGAPWALWLMGFALMTVVATESLFRDVPPDVAAIASFATYVTAATVALLMVGFMFLFAVCCAAMLSWLRESLRPARVARAVSLAFWAMTANAWIGAILVAIDPPASIDMDALLLPSADENAEDLLGMPWLSELRHASSVAFAAACFILLARSVKPLHALLAVLFASATVVFITSALGWLGDTGL